MGSGRIARLVRDRGFGFIRPDGQLDRDGDVFFHRSDCDPFTPFESLKEGDTMQFEMRESPKGMRATHVVRV